MSVVVIKLGGSLFDLDNLGARCIDVVANLRARQAITRVAVVAGGGGVAEQVRTFQRQHPAIDDASAHQAACSSLTTTATLIGALLNAPRVASRAEWSQSNADLTVIDPAPLLASYGRFETLPASWDITSDSISLHVASALRANELVLLKSQDCPSSVEIGIARDQIDRGFATTLQRLSSISISWANLRSSEFSLETLHQRSSAKQQHEPATYPPRDDVIARALVVASLAHAGQTRKGSAVPYLTHPIEVSRILREHGFGESAATLHAAALLHDAVEDTPVTLAELNAQFPADVATWVAWMSETKTDSDGSKLPWKTRKREHIERMRKAPWQACALELADKIHNLRDILAQPRPDSYWSIFSAPPQDLVWYYQTMVEASHRPGHVDRLTHTATCLVDQFREIVASVSEPER